MTSLGAAANPNWVLTGGKSARLVFDHRMFISLLTNYLYSEGLLVSRYHFSLFINVLLFSDATYCHSDQALRAIVTKIHAVRMRVTK